MVVKSRKIPAIIVCFALLIFAFIAFLFFDRQTASAATYSDSAKYQLDIDCKFTNTNNSYGFYIYGDSTSSEVLISSGAVFNFAPKKFEIKIPKGSSSSYHSMCGRVYNISLSGPMAFSTNDVLMGSVSSERVISYNFSGLANGSYTFSFTKDESYTSSTSPGGTNSGFQGEKSCSFSFVVDAPNEPVHQHEYTSTVTNATCTATGKVEYKCNCGAHSDITLPELGHSYKASTVSPTCTAEGYTMYVCTKCGGSYEGDRTLPLGHNLTQTRTINCLSETVVYSCSRCSYSTTSVGEGYGHNYVANVVEATCTDEGYTIYQCSNCGDSYRTNTTKPLGHNYKQTTYPATCTEGSYTLHECSRCGDSYKDNISQPLGHNFVEEEKPPTCTESGKIVYCCQVCGYEKGESDGSLPTGHDYTSVIITEATCTEDGLRRSTCDNCGHTYDTKIKAHGHTYEITDMQTSDGFTTRTYTCRECGDSYTQELGNQYEEVTNYVEYLFEQYEPYMWWVLLATAGVWSIAIGVAIILAHRNEDKEKAKKMLINYVVGLVVIATIVAACPYLIRGIAILVTS